MPGILPLPFLPRLSTTVSSEAAIGGGNVTLDQVQALLTATIQQIGGTLADALKNVKSGNDNWDFTAGVKVEVQHLKDDRHAKVLEHIELVISMAALRGLGMHSMPQSCMTYLCITATKTS